METKKLYMTPAMEVTKLSATNAILENSSTTVKAKSQIQNATWDEE